MERRYHQLPFSWDNRDIKRDRRWLESTLRNAAAFSDWWTKVRIVQLAMPTPPGASAEIYAGKTSEAEIVNAIQQLDRSGQHPYFAQAVDEDYVIDTLNDWVQDQFFQAISRNFEVYADLEYSNVFLVTSTVSVSQEVDRCLPTDPQVTKKLGKARFRSLFNIKELGQIIHRQGVKQLTLRTHGYANPSVNFYKSFTQEAIALNCPDAKTQARTLKDDHFYIGYHWPSEQPLFSRGLWSDYSNHLGVVVKFLVALSALAGVFSGLFYGIFWALNRFNHVSGAPFSWLSIFLVVLVLWTMVFLFLRIVVYQRDRYRAVHYGSPDLAEFVWRLDRSLEKEIAAATERSHPEVISPAKGAEDPASEPSESTPSPHFPTPTLPLQVNLVGHSMGGLLLVNTLRILSGFGKDDRGTLAPDATIDPEVESIDSIGKYLRLDKLILASPDIPMEFLREGRNNYVRSAMRRSRRIYLMSSDRDVVLRYLSTVGNWFIEPSIQMAGLRLGNIYLKRTRNTTDSPYLPYVRILFHSESAVQSTPSYELLRKFNYIDCSEMRGDDGRGGVNLLPFKLTLITGPLIDLIHSPLYLLGINRLDVHGGYFQTNTRSFQILKFLLTASFLADDVIKDEIEKMTKGTPIRFLPSQPWVMPEKKGS